MCPCFCLFAAEHIYQDKVYCYQFSIDCTSVPSCRCPIYSVLYSFTVLSCYVSCECSSVQKTKLRKTIQAKTSCYSAWVYFQYLLSFFFSSSLRFMLFPPPNLELIMSVCMAFVTLVESCSDSRRPCWREGEEEAPAAGCRELPVTTSCVVRISELCVTCCFSLRVWM